MTKGRPLSPCEWLEVPFAFPTLMMLPPSWALLFSLFFHMRIVPSSLRPLSVFATLSTAPKIISDKYVRKYLGGFTVGVNSSPA